MNLQFLPSASSFLQNLFTKPKTLLFFIITKSENCLEDTDKLIFYCGGDSRSNTFSKDFTELQEQLSSLPFMKAFHAGKKIASERGYFFQMQYLEDIV